MPAFNLSYFDIWKFAVFFSPILLAAIAIIGLFGIIHQCRLRNLQARVAFFYFLGLSSIFIYLVLRYRNMVTYNPLDIQFLSNLPLLTGIYLMWGGIKKIFPRKISLNLQITLLKSVS